MQSQAITVYMKFGTGYRYLQDAQQGWWVHKETFILDNINWFLGYLHELELPVTRRVVEQEGLLELRDELAESDLDHGLTADQASRLRDIMNAVRNTLFAEALGRVAFVVSEKRIDVNKLLSDVPALLAPRVFDSLPDIAQYDLMEAGKCIAFERPTAAAFHLLRGTEAMLREFYCAIVKKGRVKLLWGPMVEHLRERKTQPPPAPLLDHLDNIRRSFRNPTQHPDMTYDIQEAQDLFHLCVDALNRMVSFLYW